MANDDYSFGETMGAGLRSLTDLPLKRKRPPLTQEEAEAQARALRDPSFLQSIGAGIESLFPDAESATPADAVAPLPAQQTARNTPSFLESMSAGMGNYRQGVERFNEATDRFAMNAMMPLARRFTPEPPEYLVAEPAFVRDGARLTGPSGAYTELGTPRVVRKGPIDDEELAPLINIPRTEEYNRQRHAALAEKLRGLSPAPSAKAKAAPATKEEGLPPGPLSFAVKAREAQRKAAEPAIGVWDEGTVPQTLEEAAARRGEAVSKTATAAGPQERTPSTRQEVADTSEATSSDGPDVSGIYKQAALDELENVGRSLRGEALLRVAPKMQARKEIGSWLEKKEARKARMAELEQQEVLKMVEALMRRKDAMDLEAQRRTERAEARAETQSARAEEAARQRAFQAQQAAERRDFMRELARQRGENQLPTIGPKGELVGGTPRGRTEALRERALEPRAEYEPIDPKKPTFRTPKQAVELDDMVFGVDAIKGHAEDAKKEYNLWREQVKSGNLADAMVTAGKLNARMMNMHARMTEAENLQKTVAGAEAMNKILAFQNENALNPKNIALSERLPAILDAAVESSEKTLDALAKSRNLKKKSGAKAEATAAGNIVKVRSKATGTVKSLPAEAAQKYLAQADKFEEVK